MIRGAWVIALALAACGTPPPSWAPDAGPCTPYVVPAGTKLDAPAVSFAHDVMPILTHNCSSSSCHGIADGAKANLFLGAQLSAGSDRDKVYQALVGIQSTQLGRMLRITGGNPSESYLMHKLDNDQCQYDAECATKSCDRGMPYATGQLGLADRDIVRRWIAQGADNN